MRAGCRSIVLTIVVALASAVLTSVSGADTAKTASLSMTSDPYEPLLGGQSRSFDTQNGDAFTSWTGDNNNAVEIDVRAADGEWWTLDFRAPPGQPLTPGTYDGAVRSAFAGDGQPGMDISGNFVGCNTISGSFTVLDATVGPTTYLDSLDISFEQHCDGSAAALRGEIRLVNEPPPPPLAIVVTIDRKATIDSNGNVTVTGTAACNRPSSAAPTVPLLGLTSQRYRSSVSQASFSAAVNACSTTPSPWSGTVYYGLRRGAATVSVSGSVPDPLWDRTATAAATSIIAVTN